VLQRLYLAARIPSGADGNPGLLRHYDEDPEDAEKQAPHKTPEPTLVAMRADDCRDAAACEAVPPQPAHDQPSICQGPQLLVKNAASVGWIPTTWGPSLMLLLMMSDVFRLFNRAQ
jgi:hypothetical protein